MCGIAGFHIKNPGLVKDMPGMETFVNNLLKGIEHRGKHATGFVARSFDGTVRVDKVDKTASEFIKDREKIPSDPQTVLLHTRYWTQGDPKVHANNHPVIYKTCFAVHNGHVENDYELFRENDMKRTAEVDSEAIPAMASKYGLIEPEKYLAEIEGAMATAIIDPVNYPGTLILAKGAGSPLFYIETDKFLVWASTIDAIKKAWGSVLGTPPNAKKFTEMKAGEFIAFDNESRTDGTFEVKDTYVPWGMGRNDYRGKVWDWNTRRWVDDLEGDSCGVATHREVVHTSVQSILNKDSWADWTEEKRVKAVREMVVKGRNTNQDWCVVPTFNRITREDRELLFETNDVKLTWIMCNSCNESCLDKFINKTPSWGTICADCRSANVEVYKNRAFEAEAKAKKDEADAIHLEAEVVEELTSQVDVEKSFHAVALKKVAEDTDISEEVVEWLIFRAWKSYFEQKPIMADVRDELDMRYTDYMDELWESVGDPTDPKSNGDYKPMLSYCAEHETYFEPDADCPGCVAAVRFSEASIEDKGITVKLPVCECGKFVYAGYEKCFTCRQDEATKESLQPESSPDPKKLLALSTKVCTDARCTKEPNHINPTTSERWCHIHARGRTGVLADKVYLEKSTA